jgi:hypothetical protein
MDAPLLFKFRHGLLIALLTLLYGFVMGAVFGAAEDRLKADLSERAALNLDQVYNGDVERMDKVATKSWTYYKRSHMHANGIGVVSLALVLFISFLSADKWAIRAAILFSMGGFGYGLFWLFAGYYAPVLGSTDLAKSNFAWLAIPSTGMMLYGLVFAIYLTIRRFYFSQK